MGGTIWVGFRRPYGVILMTFCNGSHTLGLVLKKDRHSCSEGHIVLAVATDQDSCSRATCKTDLVQDLHCDNIEDRISHTVETKEFFVS